MARYYASSLGRFLAVDPMDTSVIEDPQSWNLYSYARNNPLILIDPNGAEPTLVRNAIDYYPVTGASVAEAVEQASAIASAAVGKEVGPGYTTTGINYLLDSAKFTASVAYPALLMATGLSAV
ncbi:MAG: RHS repeat-associated core domain-containing protein, partial [bacterium]